MCVYLYTNTYYILYIYYYLLKCNYQIIILPLSKKKSFNIYKGLFIYIIKYLIYTYYINTIVI